MNRLIVLAALALAAPAAAQSERLLKLSEMPNGDVTSLDMNSIQVVGTSKRYWQVTKLAAPDECRVVLRRTYVEVDCNAKMRTQRAFVDYDAQGAVVASDSSLDRPAQWRPIVPGSNGELARLLVCDR